MPDPPQTTTRRIGVVFPAWLLRGNSTCNFSHLFSEEIHRKMFINSHDLLEEVDGKRFEAIFFSMQGVSSLNMNVKVISFGQFYFSLVNFICKS